MTYFTKSLPLVLFFLALLCSCEQEKTVSQEEILSTSPASASTSTPAPRPSPPPMMENVLDTVVDTLPKATRAERPVRIPAQIAFKETSYTYDTIAQGEVVEYEFKFKNVGERPLSIKDVKGSCGCTIGSYPFLDIAPNEESSIKARFDSKGKEGPQFTTITVYSNANPKGDVLSLKGVVKASNNPVKAE